MVDQTATARNTAAGTDFLQLQPASAPAKGLTAWLVDALRAAIADGRLQAGVHLPPTRVLAGELRISRGVVVEAYRRLSDEGLVTARTGVGTVVTPLWLPPRRPAPPVDVRPLPAEPLRTGPLAPPRPLPPVEIDLSPGVPDLTAFPRAAWLRAERAVLNQSSAAELGYGDPCGVGWLRQELAGWLARIRGLRVSPEDIIVVAGCAQSIALIAHTLRARGLTAIAMEDPGSRGVRDELAYWGLEPVPAAVDDRGLQVSEVVRAGVPAAFVTPAHQFPTGVVLAPRRRRALLDWAAAGGLVVEDDYDAEHRYDRAPVPALQASAPDQVAYTGSVSKALAPGMRLGWLIPPRWLHADLVAAKYATDLSCPALPQLVLAHLIAGGELDRHIRLVRARHRARRDAVLTALREQLPPVRVQGVAAGLHLLMTLPDAGEVDDTALADRIRDAGVLVHPLSWHRQRPGPPGLVLGYAAHPPDRLREAVRRIAATVRASCGTSVSRTATGS